MTFQNPRHDMEKKTYQNDKEKVKSFRYSNQKFDWKQKRATYNTFGNSLNKQNSTKRQP